MTPIERMARAAAEFDGRPFDAMGRVDRERYLARAKVEWAAIREPTKAMMAAAAQYPVCTQSIDGDLGADSARSVWELMHAALNEGQTR